MAGAEQPGRAPQGELLHVKVANALGAAIVTGAYDEGDQLPGEMSASREFAVSRPAYREAIRMLASKGLISSRAKAGTHVCPRSAWNLLDPDVLRWLLADGAGRSARQLLELRAMLEPAAAAVAAVRRTDADLKAMARALAAMDESPPDSLPGQAADRRFHEALFAATGNEFVARLASIVAASVEAVAEYKRTRRVDRDPRPDHEALFHAVRDAQPEQAAAIMRSLLDHADADLGDAE